MRGTRPQPDHAAARNEQAIRSGVVETITGQAGYRDAPARQRHLRSSAGSLTTNFTRKLAFELGPFGITINAIAPSLTLTERIRPHWDKRTEEAQAAEIARTPLRRVAEAADQAKVICFLASSDADFVTGVTIDVTGGN